MQYYKEFFCMFQYLVADDKINAFILKRKLIRFNVEWVCLDAFFLQADNIIRGALNSVQRCFREPVFDKSQITPPSCSYIHNQRERERERERSPGDLNMI